MKWDKPKISDDIPRFATRSMSWLSTLWNATPADNIWSTGNMLTGSTCGRQKTWCRVTPQLKAVLRTDDPSRAVSLCLWRKVRDCETASNRLQRQGKYYIDTGDQSTKWPDFQKITRQSAGIDNRLHNSTNLKIAWRHFTELAELDLIMVGKKTIIRYS